MPLPHTTSLVFVFLLKNPLFPARVPSRLALAKPFRGPQIPCMRQQGITVLLATMRASIRNATTTTMSSSSAVSSAAARSSSSAASAAAASFLRRPLLCVGGRPRPYSTTRPGAISISSPLSLPVRASADSRRSLAAEAAAVSSRFFASVIVVVKASFPMLRACFPPSRCRSSWLAFAKLPCIRCYCDLF